MHHQQGGVNAADFVWTCGAQVVNELLFNRKLPVCQCDVGDTVVLDGVDIARKLMDYVLRF